MPYVAMCMPMVQNMMQRVDTALTERGLCKSRSRAKALITGGKVLCNGAVLTKPSAQVSETDILEVTEDLRYVGRGGLKLEGALQAFPVPLAGRVCMDIGASTGGFTDCMLQNGAALVYAVDVGHDQLDVSLRTDSRVVNLEGTDVRSVAKMPETPDFCSIDVSFISLKLVLPAVYTLLAEQADCMALIKPQFEAGRTHIGKGGIVKPGCVHVQVLHEVLASAQQTGFAVQGICPSPIQGGDGNIEYLAYLTKGRPAPDVSPDIQAVVG